jgi:hypothetical protein
VQHAATTRTYLLGKFVRRNSLAPPPNDECVRRVIGLWPRRAMIDDAIQMPQAFCINRHSIRPRLTAQSNKTARVLFMLIVVGSLLHIPNQRNNKTTAGNDTHVLRIDQLSSHSSSLVRRRRKWNDKRTIWDHDMIWIDLHAPRCGTTMIAPAAHGFRVCFQRFSCPLRCCPIQCNLKWCVRPRYGRRNRQTEHWAATTPAAYDASADSTQRDRNGGNDKHTCPC